MYKINTCTVPSWDLTGTVLTSITLLCCIEDIKYSIFQTLTVIREIFTEII